MWLSTRLHNINYLWRHAHFLFLVLGKWKLNPFSSLSILFFAEKLRRKDAEVAKALEEKERLIADILHISPPPTSSSTSLDVYVGRTCSDDIDNDNMTSSDALNQHQITDKDATKFLLAALEQGTQRNFTFEYIDWDYHINLDSW